MNISALLLKARNKEQEIGRYSQFKQPEYGVNALIRLYRVKYMFLLLLLLSGSDFCFSSSLQAAEALPSITLSIPENPQHRDYLGIDGNGGEEFILDEIDADILIIELFSMYCPYCQAEAPLVNELHSLARQQEEKGITIKIIGLGASNSQFEVEQFGKKYAIEFPLFPDKNLGMYKKLGGEGTPGFLGCLIKEGRQSEIILRQSGGFDSADTFLHRLLQQAGYKYN